MLRRRGHRTNHHDRDPEGDDARASRRRITVVWLPSGHVLLYDHLVPDPPPGRSPEEMDDDVRPDDGTVGS